MVNSTGVYNVDAVQLLSCVDGTAPGPAVSNVCVDGPKRQGSPLLCECVDGPKEQGSSQLCECVDGSEDCGTPLWDECVDGQMICPADSCGEVLYDGTGRQNKVSHHRY